MNAIEGFVPPDVIQTFAAFLEFCYITHHNVINEHSLKDLEAALQQFRQFCTVFSGTVRADGLTGFALPRQHSLTHYHSNIKKFGAPNSLCSSITESKHIITVKRPWCQSSRYKALSQILQVNQKLDKLAAAKADFASHGMLAGSSLTTALGNTNHDGANNGNNSGMDGHSNGNGTNNSNKEVDDGHGNHDGDDEAGVVESVEPLMNEVWLASEKGRYSSFSHILEFYI